MKFYEIALFVLAFNLVLGFVTAIPVEMNNSLEDNPMGIAPDEQWNITDRFEIWNASAQNVGDVNLGYGDIVGAVGMVIGAFSDATVTMPIMLAEFGLPVELILVFTSLTWMTYGAGMIQMWSGRNVER